MNSSTIPSSTTEPALEEQFHWKIRLESISMGTTSPRILLINSVIHSGSIAMRVHFIMDVVLTFTEMTISRAKEIV